MNELNLLDMDAEEFIYIPTGAASLHRDEEYDIESILGGGMDKPLKNQKAEIIKIQPNSTTSATNEKPSLKTRLKGHSLAYASLLCVKSGIGDDETNTNEMHIQKAMALAYSWKLSKSEFPLIFMAPFIEDLLKEEALVSDIRKVGAKVLSVPSFLDIFIRHRTLHQKQERVKKSGLKAQLPSRETLDDWCKYSKIQAWNLVEYERVVYLDPETIIVSNIDELFEYREFAAVKTAGDVYSTSVFVAEPSSATYQSLVKALKYGEAAVDSSFRSLALWESTEHFLNWYWEKHQRNNHNTLSLSSKFNVGCRNKDYALWNQLKKSAKIFNFVGEATPWDFYRTKKDAKAHLARRTDWTLHYEPNVFFHWKNMYENLLKFLNRDPYLSSPFLFENEKVESLSKRSSQICSSFKIYDSKSHIIVNKFSVLIGTFDRVELLQKAILHYKQSKLVHAIYVTWHDPKSTPPKDFLRSLQSDDSHPKVIFIQQSTNSLNNRFNPIKGLATKAVLVCDDDIRVTIREMEWAFEAWKTRQYSLVGLFPRYHAPRKPTDENRDVSSSYVYEMRSPRDPRSYSIMLTKWMFMRAEYLWAYTCLLPASIHAYIDAKMNCEDIAMSLIVNNLSGSPVTAIYALSNDYGTKSGISSRPGHNENRATCVEDLIKLIGGDPESYSHEVLKPFADFFNATQINKAAI